MPPARPHLPAPGRDASAGVAPDRAGSARGAPGRWTVTWAGALGLLALLLLAGPCLAQAGPPPTLTELQAAFARLYQCPEDHGLSTFSALIRSEQVTFTANSLGLPPPALELTYGGLEGFTVAYDRDTLLQVEKGSLIADVADAIANAAEGFFQAYETLAFRNLCTRLPATPTISLTGTSLVVAYPDRAPGQTVQLTFDAEFRLLMLEAADAASRSVQRLVPRWVRLGEKFVLVSIEVEFLQGGSSSFQTLFKVENEPCQGFLLPSRVTLCARDGGMESSRNALIDFHVASYSLGLKPR
ncbi:MAG: hypothetical protein GX442_10755 [Candidatus Riflebacteria bacterium]|nr:hypothetical protein [Candidatus Riflebacteria bacterium]